MLKLNARCLACDRHISVPNALLPLMMQALDLLPNFANLQIVTCSRNAEELKKALQDWQAQGLEVQVQFSAAKQKLVAACNQDITSCF